MTTQTLTPDRTSREPKATRGDARWFFGQLAIIRATAADTDGAYSLIEVHAPAGLEAPLHVHHREDEGFLILDGEVTFTVGEETTVARDGDFLLGRRGVPHKFVVGSEGARMLWVMTPAGFEDMVVETSVPARELVPPPPDVEPPANAAEIVARYGNELLA